MGLDLPRLIALLGYAIALSGAASLFFHVPLLPRTVLLLGLAAGLLAERRSKPLIHHLLLTTGSILLFVWYAAQFSIHNPALPVVSILMVLLGTRLAAEKTARTWLQTCTIALFCLASSSLFDLGPRFLLLLALMLPLLALLLVLLTFQSQGLHLDRLALRRAITTGLLIPFAALLLTPLFFPILPRTQLPLWNFIQQAGGSQPSGLSDTVTPGMAAQVPDTGLLVFRAEMPPLEPQRLYWRGATFSRLHGLQWQRDPAAGLPSMQPLGRQITQIITMEPGSSRALIGLDLPTAFLHQNGSLLPTAVWNRPLPPSRRLRYEVRSTLADHAAVSTPDVTALTRLPAEVSPRLRRHAERFRQNGTTDRQRLTALETWFRTSGFRYSRDHLPTGDDALDQFLFERKNGHCEFFASGFALLARGAGLPARLVGGYYGGDYNELGGYYRVSEERAHVWVEVWLNGSGWIRLDPSSMAVNADTALGTPRQHSLTMRLRLLLDSLDYSWNSAIISYDFERQLQVATSTYAQLHTLHWRDARRLLLPAALLASSAAAVWLAVRVKQSGLIDRRTRLLLRFRHCVEREFGIPRDAQIGLFDIAHQADTPAVLEFVNIYAGSLYRETPLSPTDLRRLAQLLRAPLKQR